MDQNVQTRNLLEFIRKIPIFSDLSGIHLKKILTVCSKISLKKNGILCKKGNEAQSMFILLQGKLAIKVDDKSVVATIDPISSIGEMGVFTEEPRTATVEAMENSALLCLRKADIDKLINSDFSFGVTLMRKVIKVLSERIKEDNIKMRDFQSYIISQEEDKISNNPD